MMMGRINTVGAGSKPALDRGIETGRAGYEPAPTIHHRAALLHPIIKP